MEVCGVRRFAFAGMVAGLVFTSSCEREREVPKAVAFRDDGVLEVKAMTFNIRYENEKDRGVHAWRERVVGIVGEVRREGVDVLGIQEGQHGQVADLRVSLPDYDFSGFGRDDGKRSGEYAGLFFRKDRFEKDETRSGMIWLSATPEIAGSKTWGNEIPRVANWVRLLDRVSGRAMWVINVHLDHRSQASRERGVRLMAERLVAMNPDSEPVIFMGDFNATEGNEVVKFLSGRNSSIASVRGFDGLTETFGKLHPGVIKGSVNFWRSDPKLQWKLDHILVSKDVEVIEAGILRHKEPYLSDHFAVVARVRWSGEAR